MEAHAIMLWLSNGGHCIMQFWHMGPNFVVIHIRMQRVGAKGRYPRVSIESLYGGGHPIKHFLLKDICEWETSKQRKTSYTCAKNMAVMHEPNMAVMQEPWWDYYMSQHMTVILVPSCDSDTWGKNKIVIIVLTCDCDTLANLRLRCMYHHKTDN